MSEQPNILKDMDDEAIKWQKCAICGEQKQRVVRQPGRPDFALCDHCRSAFVLEDGGKMQMLYGNISEKYPQVRKFALKQWHTYFEIRAIASQENPEADNTDLPTELKDTSGDTVHGTYTDSQEAILKLEAEKSDIFYSRAKKLEPPPRRLRETGELPNLDELFKDPD